MMQIILKAWEDEQELRTRKDRITDVLSSKSIFDTDSLWTRNVDISPKVIAKDTVYVLKLLGEKRAVEEVNKKNLSFQGMMFAVYWVLLTFLWEFKKTKGLF